MSTLISGTQVRSILLGTRVEKSTGTLAATTIGLFTVTGTVAITSLYGEVTTAITVANSYKLQHNPTTGTTGNLCAATDIGTTDTPAGSLLSFDGVAASSIQQNPGVVPMLLRPLALTAGSIESVSAGTDGAILWVLTYVPLSNDGAIVAA